MVPCEPDRGVSWVLKMINLVITVIIIVAFIIGCVAGAAVFACMMIREAETSVFCPLCEKQV
jgi:hypothetical protein